jgi:hypothetical protein
LFFRKSGYNIYEIFILCCYLSGIGALFLSVVSIFQILISTHLNIIKYTSIIVVAYHIWSIGQFIDKKKVVSYIKASLSVIMGAITLFILIAFLGTLIDIIR